MQLSLQRRRNFATCERCDCHPKKRSRNIVGPFKASAFCPELPLSSDPSVSLSPSSVEIPIYRSRWPWLRLHALTASCVQTCRHMKFVGSFFTRQNFFSIIPQTGDNFGEHGAPGVNGGMALKKNRRDDVWKRKKEEEERTEDIGQSNYDATAWPNDAVGALRSCICGKSTPRQSTRTRLALWDRQVCSRLVREDTARFLFRVLSERFKFRHCGLGGTFDLPRGMRGTICNVAASFAFRSRNFSMVELLRSESCWEFAGLFTLFM